MKSYVPVALLPALMLFFGCDDGNASSDGDADVDSSPDGDSDSDVDGDADGDADSDVDHDGDSDVDQDDQDGDVDRDSDRPAFEPPELAGQVLVGHYLPSYDVHSFDGATLAATEGSPREMPWPTGDMAAISALDAIVITHESGAEIAALSRQSLEPIEGSPYATEPNATAIAHDRFLDRLYIYCLGATPGASEAAVTVYDTSSLPWQQTADSPIALPLPAIEMAADPVTGRVYGVSLGRVFAVAFEGGEAIHVGPSPLTIDDGVGSGLAIDPMRRRLYFGERRLPGPQLVHALDMDSLEPAEGSPVSYDGAAVGDLVVDPMAGHLFVVDYGTDKLHALSPDPLTMMNTCGAGGCDLLPTETGLALDYTAQRLYIAHIPDNQNPEIGPGSLSVWDVSDPGQPAEVTTSENRPRVALYPVRVEVM